MSENIKLLRLFSFLSRDLVAGARKKSVVRFNESLNELDFFVTKFSPSTAKIPSTATTPASPAMPQVIDLLMIDEAKFGKYISGEAHKFFLASMISLERARQSQQHNLSWQVVEHYYSAYYAVHYLMRIAGYSLTNIDERSLRSIKSSSLVDSNNLKSGLCTLEFTQCCKNVKITKNDGGGGSHKDAWNIWGRIVDALIVECKKDTSEYASLELELLSHKRFITIDNSRFNPSEIRGEVNYQFKGEAWCFENNTGSQCRPITKVLSVDEFDLALTDSRVSNLINNNKLIINLARSFFNYSRESFSQGICRSLHNQFKEKIKIIN